MNENISKRSLVWLPLILMFLLVVSVSHDGVSASEKPDFSGNWRLNEELSEDPREKMMETMGGAGGRSGSGGGRGGGMSGGGGRGMGGGMNGGGGPGSSGGGGGRGGDREDMQGRLQARTERIETLNLLHQDPELRIEFADGSIRTIYTDGRVTQDDFESGIFDGQGKWKKDSQLVFQSESSYGGELTETYELNPSGDMLFVTTKMKGGGDRPTIKYRRVYDLILADVPTAEDTDLGD